MYQSDESEGHVEVSETMVCWCAVNVFATFGAIAFVDRLGRRNMLLIASVHMFVTQIIVAGLLGAEFEKFGSGLPQSISIAILVVCLPTNTSLSCSLIRHCMQRCLKRWHESFLA